MIFRPVSSAQNAADHISYRDFVNWQSDITGKSTAFLNTEHYLRCRYKDVSDHAVTQLCRILWRRERNDHLLWYFAGSFHPDYEHSAYYNFLRDRQPIDACPRLTIYPYEVQVLRTKHKFLLGDLAAFDMSLKANPTAKELADFALRKPVWSILFPIKSYLLDHADVAKEYRGLMPMGKDVVNYYNKFLQSCSTPGTEEPVVSMTGLDGVAPESEGVA